MNEREFGLLVELSILGRQGNIVRRVSPSHSLVRDLVREQHRLLVDGPPVIVEMNSTFS